MSDDLDQITSTFNRFSAAWKTNDAAAVAGFFAEDGSLVNPFGQRADGRAGVAAMYAEYFGGMLRGSSTTINVTRVRAVGHTHAFADGEQTIHAADGTVLLALRIAALLARDGGGWRIVDARPYTLATIPGES
jgi:uncharacterized protein (TIGR02246 family)